MTARGRWGAVCVSDGRVRPGIEIHSGLDSSMSVDRHRGSPTVVESVRGVSLLVEAFTIGVTVPSRHRSNPGRVLNPCVSQAGLKTRRAKNRDLMKRGSYDS